MACTDPEVPDSLNSSSLIEDEIDTKSSLLPSPEQMNHGHLCNIQPVAEVSTNTAFASRSIKAFSPDTYPINLKCAENSLNIEELVKKLEHLETEQQSFNLPMQATSEETVSRRRPR